MITEFLGWLGTLPPAAIYAVLGLLGFTENIFPPVPADTAIALGALLSAQGHINVWIVFGITIVTNLIGAMGVYWFASHHSSALFESKLARRLLPEEGLTFVRREYQRFGLPGLFIARLLPGFRAIVPPFAGLIKIPPFHLSIVMGLASAAWYGGIIYGASKLGEHWEDISAFLSHLNTGLAIVAAFAAALLGYWLWRRARRRRTADG